MITQMHVSSVWTPSFCPQTEQYSSLDTAIILKLKYTVILSTIQETTTVLL